MWGKDGGGRFSLALIMEIHKLRGDTADGQNPALPIIRNIP